MFQEEEMIIINESELAEFIQDKLRADGIAVAIEDIERVLHYEMEFLESKGVIKYGDEE